MAKQQKWAKLSPEKREEIKAAREKKLTTARLQLTSGVEALLKGNRWKEYLQFSQKFHQYSFSNIMLIMLQRPDARQVASFQSWKSMGRFVKKGEHGIEIFVPIFCRNHRIGAQQPLKDIGLGDGESLCNETGEERLEENAGKTLVGFKMGSVFDVSQTDGLPLPEHPCTRLEGDDAGVFAVLKEAVETFLQIPVAFETLPPGTYGCCHFNPDQDCHPIAITISDDPTLSGVQRLDTLAHEAGHAMLHSGLEYRHHTERSIRELEAESVAYCILSALGFDSSQVSFGYLAIWAEIGGEDCGKEIERSGQRILEASRCILGWMEENMGVLIEIQMATKAVELVAV
jgi:antirestriction protein ArdC